MNLSVSRELSREFRHHAGTVFQQRLLREQHRKQERRERQKEIENEANDLVDLVAAIVTSAEIIEFKEELATYDAATVSALQENGRELELVQERLDDILSRAHVLPDGRRVFKTDDGLRVFDEHGIELDAETITPDMINDYRPRWETAKPVIDQLNMLLEQRSLLVEYQSKLDEARERLDAGEMTREEFEKLRTDLKDSMPEEVRKQIPSMEKETELTEDKTADATDKLDISRDMVPTSMTPKM